MFFHLPFGHADVRVDSRTPRETRVRRSSEVIRDVRRSRS
jgi:hypothetical protein